MRVIRLHVSEEKCSFYIVKSWHLLSSKSSSFRFALFYSQKELYSLDCRTQLISTFPPILWLPIFSIKAILPKYKNPNRLANESKVDLVLLIPFPIKLFIYLFFFISLPCIWNIPWPTKPAGAILSVSLGRVWGWREESLNLKQFWRLSSPRIFTFITIFMYQSG